MRVQFEIDEDVLAKIDKYAKMQGLNRTTFIRSCIGDRLMAYEKLFNIVENNVHDMCMVGDAKSSEVRNV